MKKYNLLKPASRVSTCYLMAVILLMLSCRKEKVLEASKLDNNYFVIRDNPNDHVDHAIYEFYKSTGIAGFYKDSIYQKQISKDNEVPARYTNIKLSLTYSPTGSRNVQVYHKPLLSTNNIPGLLKLLQDEMIPQLPSNYKIPSLFLIDSFTTTFYAFVNMKIEYGWTSIYGFNTVGVVVKDVGVMSEEERKMYAASILAGIAMNRINEHYSDQLQKDFFSISRAVTKNLMVDIYSNIPFIYVLLPDKVPAPQNIGFLFHPTLEYSGIPMETMPRYEDDVRAFLTVAFYYTSQEFVNLYPDEKLVQEKFNVIRNLAKEAGFKLPE